MKILCQARIMIKMGNLRVNYVTHFRLHLLKDNNAKIIPFCGENAGKFLPPKTNSMCEKCEKSPILVTRKTFLLTRWQLAKFFVQKRKKFFEDKNLIHPDDKLQPRLFLRFDNGEKKPNHDENASREREERRRIIKSLLMENNKHLTNWVPGRHKEGGQS